LLFLWLKNKGAPNCVLIEESSPVLVSQPSEVVYLFSCLNIFLTAVLEEFPSATGRLISEGMPIITVSLILIGIWVVSSSSTILTDNSDAPDMKGDPFWFLWAAPYVSGGFRGVGGGIQTTGDHPRMAKLTDKGSITIG